MRIVNSKQFLSLPAGTVFSKWGGYGASGQGIAVKGDSLPHQHYQFCDLVHVMPTDDYDYETSDPDPFSMMEDLAESGVSAKADYWSYGRDCCYEPSSQFLIIEPSDVASLIVRLTKAMNDSGCSQDELVRLLGEASIANTLDDEQVAE